MKVFASLARLDRRLRIAGAVLVAVLMVGGVVAMISLDDGSKRSEQRAASGTGTEPRRRQSQADDEAGSDRTTSSTPSTSSTTSTTSAPTTTTTTTTSTVPATHPADAGQPTPPPGDVEPESPPAVALPGAQGPVRPQPCTPTGPPTATLPFTDGPSADGKSWVTVASIEGNCGGESPAFRAAGIDTRLLFRSDAEQFLVFVDDLDDADAAAGYADVECRSRCAGEQILVNGAGNYRLRVNATDGPWELLFQEYR